MRMDHRGEEERMRGVRRLEGVEEEYEYSLIRRAPLLQSQRELIDLRAQLRQFEEEWAYKMRRDADSLEKTLTDASDRQS